MKFANRQANIRAGFTESVGEGCKPKDCIYANLVTRFDH
jgi:hypothetical protein